MNKPVYRLLFLLFGAMYLSACASPAEMKNMVVARQPAVTAEPNSSFKNALTIARVDGGEATNPLWTSEVGGAEFQGALHSSLEKNALLANAEDTSRFDLFASLGSVNQPLFGLDLTVSSTVIYRVVERDTKIVWFNDSVVGSYTATFSDAPIAIQRLRLANEGSIRENIKEFIKQLISTEPPISSRSTITNSGKSSVEKLLQNLIKLLDDGLITKEDFDLKKRQILKDI